MVLADRGSVDSMATLSSGLPSDGENRKAWLSPFKNRSFGWPVGAANSDHPFRSAAEKATPDEYIPEPVSRVVLESYLHKYGLVQHHIQSFDQFFLRKIPSTIRDFGSLRFFNESSQTMHIITFVCPQVHRPRFREPDGTSNPMTVQEARARLATYQAEVTCRILHDVYRVKEGHYVTAVMPHSQRAAAERAKKWEMAKKGISPEDMVEQKDGEGKFGEEEGKWTEDGEGEGTRDDSQTNVLVSEASGTVGRVAIPTVGVVGCAPGLMGLREDDEVITEMDVAGVFVSERRRQDAKYGDDAWLQRDYEENKKHRQRLHERVQRRMTRMEEGRGGDDDDDDVEGGCLSGEESGAVYGGDVEDYAYLAADKRKWRGAEVIRVLRMDGVGEDWVLAAELDRAEMVVDGRFKRVERVISDGNEIVTLPCMIGSSLCYTRDMPESATTYSDRVGGGFITNGASKRPFAQVTRRSNHFMVFPPARDKDGKLLYRGEIRARVDSKDRSTGTLQLNLSTGPGCTGFTQVTAHMNYFKGTFIPIFALFRLLGARSVKQVARMIAWGGRVAEDDIDRFPERPETKSFELWIQSILTYRPVIKKSKRPSLEEQLSSSDEKRMPDFENMSWEDVINWVGAYATDKRTRNERIANIRHLIGNELEPQHGQHTDSRSLRQKRAAVSFYVWRMLRVARGEDYTDFRDDAANMCLETIGQILSISFRQQHRFRIRNMLKTVRIAIEDRQHFNAADKFHGSRTSFKILTAIRSGRAGETYQGGTSTNITNSSKPKNTHELFSELRAVYKRGDPNSKKIEPKLLSVGEWSQFGPSHTPEGETCGRRINLPQTAYVVMGVSFQDLFARVVDHMGPKIALVGEEPPEWNPSYATTAPLFINGVMVGLVDGASHVVRQLRAIRRRGMLPHEVSIHSDERHGAVYLDAVHGTIRTARFVLEPLEGFDPGEDFREETKRRTRRIRDIVGETWVKREPISEKQWNRLMEEGLVELLSKEEERCTRVRSNPVRNMEDRHDAFEEMWDDKDIVEEIGQPILHDAGRESDRRKRKRHAEGRLMSLEDEEEPVAKKTRSKATSKPNGSTKRQQAMAALRKELGDLAWYELPIGEEEAREAVERAHEIQEQIDESVSLSWDKSSERDKRLLERELQELQRFLERPVRWNTISDSEKEHSIRDIERELYAASHERERELENAISTEEKAIADGAKTPRPRFDPALDAALPRREKFAWYRALRSIWDGSGAMEFVKYEAELASRYLPPSDTWRMAVTSLQKAKGREVFDAFRLFMATCGDALMFPRVIETLRVVERLELKEGDSNNTWVMRRIFEKGRAHALRLTGELEESGGPDAVEVESRTPQPTAKLIRYKQQLTTLRGADVCQGRRYWAELTWRKRLRQSRRLLRLRMERRELQPHAQTGMLTQFTHAELHATSFFSMATALAPFSNHNQAARITFFDAMGASSQEASPPDASEFSTYSELEGGEIPVVQTVGERMLGRNRVPYGVNAIVALACLDGRNVEDGMILNKGFVDRGALRVMKRRPYMATATQGAKMDEQMFEKPDPTVVRNVRAASLEKITEKGYPRVGTRLLGGDYVIGRTNINREKGGEVIKRDTSVLARVDDGPGVVESVIMTNGRDRSKQLTVQTRSLAIPEVGDKLSTRHAQKGVIGEIVDEVDLPYAVYTRPKRHPDTGEVAGTYTGCLKPDVIMNPHAMPSRMTHGQMIESVLGWLSVLTGTTGDATAFQAGVTTEAIASHLRTLGWSENGEFEMRSGVTGHTFRAKVFMGPVYVMRLAQMASTKIHARRRGPLAMLTMEPLGGKARQGGNRYGEMELTNLHGYGAAQLMWERSDFSSNPYLATVCRECGYLAEDMREAPTQLQHLGNQGVGGKEPMCRVCETGEHVTHIRVPYVVKQLWFYLAGMGIAPRFKVTSSREIDFASQPAPAMYTKDGIIPIPESAIVGRPDTVRRARLAVSSTGRNSGKAETTTRPNKRPRATPIQTLPGGAKEAGPDPLAEFKL